MGEGTDGHQMLLCAARLYDGTDAPPVEDAAVLVDGDRIVAAGGRAEVLARADPSCQVRDWGSATILPGLVDPHFHAGYCGHRGMAELEAPRSVEFQALSAGINVQTALRCGITSAMDVGSRGRIGVAVRDAVNEGVVDGPRLRVSGQMIDTIGGAVDLWPGWICVDGPAALGVLVSGEQEVIREVRRQVKERVDNVKVIASGSIANRAMADTPIALQQNEMRAAVDVAHAHGVTVASHAEGPTAIRNSLAAGIDTIHHCTGFDRSVLDELPGGPDAPVRIVFTLGVYAGIIRSGRAHGYPEDVRQRVEKQWRRTVAGVRLAHEAGVAFAVGSDCGGIIHPHGHYASEAALLVRDCGLSVAEAVRACTSRAAKAAGFPDTGLLQAGMRADILAVRADLSTEIEALSEPGRMVMVMQAGRIAPLPG